MRMIPDEILLLNKNLQSHSMYKELNDLTSLRVFMETHAFAVWDFMSLLKALQRQVTCVNVPWAPSIYPASVVRMVNEIVLSEESDLDQEGHPNSHFQIYLKSMVEVGARTQPILEFCKTLDFKNISSAVKNFVAFNLEIATSAPPHQVAGAFLFGREKVIPGMFQGILDYLNCNNIQCPTLKYYLTRHIQLDGAEHSHLAMSCLEMICGSDEVKWKEAFQIGLQSLINRSNLWDHVRDQILKKEKTFCEV